MSRPSKDEYFMRIARVVSERSTCIRKSVGCVLVDSQYRILSTGYNGVAKGQPHCNEEIEVVGAKFGGLVEALIELPNVCEGWDLPPGEDRCEAVHAEQNSIIQCRDVDAIAVAYVTLSPCLACTKLLLNTACARIVYGELHSRSDVALELWVKTGRLVSQI